MTDRLKEWLDDAEKYNYPLKNIGLAQALAALRAVVGLHREDVGNRCMACGYSWPCQTIRAIGKEVLR